MSQQISGDFLQWLQTFLLVAETESIQRTAKMRYISPSAASLHIKKLEQDMGVELFSRRSKRMALTSAGLHLKDTCIPILESIEKLRSPKELQPALKGTVKITCINRLAHHLMPHILSFRKMHPDVQFTLDATSPSHVHRNLAEASVDMAITIYRQLPGHLKFTALSDSSAFLYTPPGNPFHVPPMPSWDEICLLPFISLTMEGYVNPVINVLPDLRRPENIVVALDDFLLAMQLVKAGMGVCIAPPLTHLESASDYTMINIDHIFPIGTFGVITRMGGYLSSHAKAFISYLVKQYRQAAESGGMPGDASPGATRYM